MAHQWKCPTCGRTVPKKLDKCFGCGTPRVVSSGAPYDGPGQAQKPHRMSCPSCDSQMTVAADVQRLTCTFCGTELLVQRGEGYAALRSAQPARQAAVEVPPVQPRQRRWGPGGCLKYTLVTLALFVGMLCFIILIPLLSPGDQAATQTTTPAEATPSRTPTQEATATTMPPPITTRTVPHAVYVVESGDTLSSIAAAFGTTAQAIMELNGLTSTTIYRGTELLIPAADAPLATSPTPSALVTTPTPRPPLPTRQPSPTPIQQLRGVYIGMPADDVLEVWGDVARTEVLGADSEGLIVAWVYPDVTLIMKRSWLGGTYQYRFTEIRLR